MKLKRTLKLVLKATKDQQQILLETIEQYRFAYNYTCEIGWKAQICNGIKLHNLTYYTVRNKSSLPSQLVISARVVATESLKSALKRKKKGLKSRCPESKNPAIRYDKRSYTVWLDRVACPFQWAAVNQPIVAVLSSISYKLLPVGRSS